MSYPRTVHLIRHGQSVGNVDRTVYAATPDHAVPLTDLGRQQARAAGEELSDVLRGRDFTTYVSPYTRTLQTWEEMLAAMPLKGSRTVIQDPRLREQEWSANPATAAKNNRNESWKEALTYGWFWYRFEGGESVADTYDRGRAFWREMLHDCPTDDAVIVSHGIAIRALLMAATDMTVEEFYTLDTPPNCARFQFNRYGGDGWGPLAYRLDPSTPFPRFSAAVPAETTLVAAA